MLTIKRVVGVRFMMRALRKLDASGATIVEFALVAPVFFLILFAVFEFGLITFSNVVIESAVMHASRAASLGKTSNSSGPCATTADRLGYVTCVIRDRTSVLINADRLIISANPVSGGGTPATSVPDICMTVPPSSPAACDPPLYYQEVNGTSGYQGPGAVNNASLGASGELVELRVSYPWRVQMPFMSSFFGCQGAQKAGCQQGIIMLTSATVFKNEPF